MVAREPSLSLSLSLSRSLFHRGQPGSPEPDLRPAGTVMRTTLCWGSWSSGDSLPRCCMLTSMCTTVTVSPFPLFLLLGRKGCGDFVVVGWYTGVEGAFSCSPSVLTVSFHKHDLGFFPGSGGLGDTGKGGGKYCAVNVPLKGGMNRASFVPLFTSVMEAAKASFSPEAVVFQCGADALAGDPTRAFNLSSECYAACLRLVLRWSLPTLVLGGGGYNHCNTAKCRTLLTAVCLEERQQRHGDGKGESVSRSENAVLAGLSEDLPEHDVLSEYAGDYSLPVRRE